VLAIVQQWQCLRIEPEEEFAHQLLRLQAVDTLLAGQKATGDLAELVVDQCIGLIA